MIKEQNGIKGLSPLQRSLLVIENLKTKLNTLEHRQSEPIAIVGMSCRFPGGANSTDEYWNLLSNGINAIDEVPSQRWDIDQIFSENPEAPGKSYCRHGGFLDNIEEFDSSFFEISPREAISIDPQHRLLLEVSWEALENANYNIKCLKGSKTGIFMGITLNDYEKVIKDYQIDLNIEAYGVTGLPLNAAAGRISYFLGLTGPSMSIDTACSSSLVAIHQACQSIRNNECNMALAGGVNLILTPDTMIGTSKAKLLSVDGQCKTFDDSANGIGRAEGCGVIVLKRLSSAIEDNDNILAVIKGSAINQDGPSSGFTVPNSISQQKLINAALEVAKIDSSQINYIEAHGTGTALGDPIELRSLKSIFGNTIKRKSKLSLASVKTNIGHCESASGVAGVIKVILQLQNKKIAPHLNFNKPTTKFDWENFNVNIPTTLQNWETNEEKRVAGVSSFGASGTNAHIIIEEAPVNRSEISENKKTTNNILTLTAKSKEALTKLAESYKKQIESSSENDLINICYTANTCRVNFNHRLAIIAENKHKITESLTNFLFNKSTDNVKYNISGNDYENVAFLFTGQGSQYKNMGKNLYDTEPLFKEVLDFCGLLLEPSLGLNLTDLLYSTNKSNEFEKLIHQTKYSQPAIVAIEYALVKLWEDRGIKPGIVMGHSVGEYTAAVVAGIISIEDCLKLIALRGKLMQKLPEGGGMISVNLSKDIISNYISPYKDQVSIAAINGPNSTVISGDLITLDKICNKIKSSGYNYTPLTVSHGFHSPLMQPIVEEFERVANSVKFNKPLIPFISNVTGRQETTMVQKAKYWTNHILCPVNFEKGIKTILNNEYKIMLEIGPKPILSGLGKQFINDPKIKWINSLSYNTNDQSNFFYSLADLFVENANCNLGSIYSNNNTKKVVLPNYPFQRKKCWIDRSKLKHVYINNNDLIPFIGFRSNKTGTRDIFFHSDWNETTPPFVADHLLFNKEVVPGASHISMILSAIQETSNDNIFQIEDIYFSEALTFEKGKNRKLEIIIGSHNKDSSTVSINSSTISQDKEIKDKRNHAKGFIRFGSDQTPPLLLHEPFNIKKIQLRCNNKVAGSEFYDFMWQADYNLGNSFRWINEIWKAEGEALSNFKTPKLADNLEDYLLFPGLIDSCFQMVGITAEQNEIKKMEKEDYIFVPFHIEKFRYYKNISSSDLWCYCTVNKEISNESILAGDITLYNENGELVAEIKNCETRKAPKKLLLQSFNALETEKYYQQNWIQKELEESDKNSLKNNKKWLIYSACDIEIKDLKKQINKEGNKYIFVSNSQNFIRESEHSYKINPNEDEQFKQIFEFNKDITNIVLISNSGANATEIDLTKIENGQNVCIAAVHLLKAILQVKFEISPTIQVVTSCTQQVFPEEIVSKPQYATLWGLFKVFRLEHPEYQCQLIDFSKEIEHDKLLQLINDETLIPIKESNIAFRNNERYVTRITKENKKTKEAISLNTDASYLITGGLGSLGLLFAKELAKRNVKNIVLTSRSKPSEYNTKKIKEIENNVTQIKTIQCDISNEDQVKILMKEIDQLKFPLKGIINAAGSLKDMPIEQLTPTSILDIMRPKIKGTWNIHKHTKLIDIDFFVCFSSMSSFIGTHYQANYAAANAFMDSFMTYRRSIGLKGLSINWGPWDKIGMANNLNDQYKSFIRKNGINFIDPEEGILVFDKLISKNQTNIAYLDIDWNKYTKGLIPLNKIAIFEELINRNYSQPEIEDEYINLLHNVSGEERNLLLNELISKEIAKITGSEISQFDVSTPLSVLGVDSLMAMEIRSIVQKKLNADIPIGKLLAGGNISDLAMIIEDELTTAQTDEQANINANNKEIEAFIEGEI